MSDLLESLGLGRPDWQARAACRGYAAEHGGRARDAVFFPDRGQSLARARTMCADCPVVQECLDLAIETNTGWGVWGGMSARERRQARAARNRNLRAAAS